MKFFFVKIFLLFILIGSSNANENIRFINIDYIVKNSEAGKTLNKIIVNKSKKITSELNDPFEQKERLLKQQSLLDKGDSEAQVLDEDFIKVLESGMPPTGGVGIGVDRLVMIFSEQKSIKDVIFFPSMRSE